MPPSLPARSRDFALLVPRRLRSMLLLALGAALWMALSACNDGGVETDPTAPSVLLVSEVWVASQAADPPGGDTAQSRVAALTEAIEDLRQETGTGWIGRQDDVTGYLAELSGGSRAGDLAALMNDHGPALFGLDSTGLALDAADSTTVPGLVTTRATQVTGGVPVLDGVLVFTGRSGGAGTDDDRITGVRGRVFPGLDVSTEPQVTQARAVRIAERESGGQSEGAPRLVVMPSGAGVLAWEVTVVSDAPVGSSDPSAGAYYVDAVTGDVVSVRRTSAELAPPLPGTSTQARARAAEPDPNDVVVTGKDGLGKELTAHGLQVENGVELTDTSTPMWDPTTRKGAIETYDASAVQTDSQLPGERVRSLTPEIRDPDVIASQAYVRAVIDYYNELGRNSWDNRGGTAVSSVNYGPDGYCNAFFNGSLDPPQMVFGNPCVRNGTVISTNAVYPDVVGHEMTHGVTATSANLIYAGQSGALNESFSDYFGNAVGNLVSGTESVAYSEDGCVGITTPNYYCEANPDGSLSMRYMLNGNDFDDYLRVLDPGYRLYLLQLAEQDYGGVHYNSAIWNNALWGIRTQLAKIDNLPGNDSPLARAFDKAVYGALVTRLGPGSGFVDARAAVEQVIIDSSLDPVVLRVAREGFDASKICTGCSTPTELAGQGVATTPSSQVEPTVSGDLVSWLDVNAGNFVGNANSQQVGGAAPVLGAGDTYEVALAGDALVAIHGAGQVVRYDGTGSSSAIGRAGDGLDGIVSRGLVGSDAGAAWANTADSLSFVDPEGTVSDTDIPGLRGDTVLSVGTGGGTVAAGTDAGKVFLWRPGTQPEQIATMNGPVASVASYGDNVLAVMCRPTQTAYVPTCQAKVLTGDGRTLSVSSNATPFGAAMSAEYAVWPEAVGKVSAGVAGGETGMPETDLYVLSLETGRIYSPLAGGAQQGFPSISGRRVVWQDAALGGDDIMTAVLPGGL